MSNSDSNSNYRIKAYLSSEHGSKDISSIVHEVVIKQSILQDLPEITLIVEKKLFQLIHTGMQQIHLAIESQVKTDQYDLLITNVHFDSMLSRYRNQLPSKELIPLDTVVYPCFKYAQKTRSPEILFNTTIPIITSKLITNQNILLKTNQLSNQHIDQIILQEETYLNLLKNVNYLFSFTKHANALTLNFNLEKQQPEVCILDYKLALEQQLFDSTVYIQVPNENNLSQTHDNIVKKSASDSQNFIITHLPLVLDSNLYNLAIKSFKFSQRSNKYYYTELNPTFEDEATKFSNFSASENNALLAFGVRKNYRIKNFTGNNMYPDAINNLIGNTLMLTGSASVQVEQLYTLHNLYPGYTIKVISAEESVSSFTGVWIIGSFIYNYSRVKTADWDSYGTLTLHRTNVSWAR